MKQNVFYLFLIIGIIVMVTACKKSTSTTANIPKTPQQLLLGKWYYKGEHSRGMINGMSYDSTISINSSKATDSFMNFISSSQVTLHYTGGEETDDYQLLNNNRQLVFPNGGTVLTLDPGDTAVISTLTTTDFALVDSSYSDNINYKSDFYLFKRQ